MIQSRETILRKVIDKLEYLQPYTDYDTDIQLENGKITNRGNLVSLVSALYDDFEQNYYDAEFVAVCMTYVNLLWKELRKTSRI